MSQDNDFGLIPIRNDFEPFVVNARELHQFLLSENKEVKVGEDFSHWIKRMITYSLIEKKDYIILNFDYAGNLLSTSLAENSETDTQMVTAHKKEYLLTITCGKQIAMVQSNEKGKQAREYFIKCEEELQQQRQIALPNFNDPAQAARAWADQYEKAKKLEADNLTKNKQLHAAEQENYKLNEINQDQVKAIQKNQPKVRLAEAINTSKKLFSWKETADALAQYFHEKLGKRYKIGQNTLLEWAREQGYLTKGFSIENSYDKKNQKWIQHRKFNNEPINIYIQRGWFWVKKTPRENDPEKVDSTTKLKAKGFREIINAYINWYNKKNGTNIQLFLL